MAIYKKQVNLRLTEELYKKLKKKKKETKQTVSAQCRELVEKGLADVEAPQRSA